MPTARYQTVKYRVLRCRGVEMERLRIEFRSKALDSLLVNLHPAGAGRLPQRQVLEIPRGHFEDPPQPEMARMRPPTSIRSCCVDDPRLIAIMCKITVGSAASLRMRHLLPPVVRAVAVLPFNNIEVTSLSG